MELGYILAAVFAVIWLGFKIFEIVQRKNAKGAVKQDENTEYTE